MTRMSLLRFAPLFGLVLSLACGDSESAGGGATGGSPNEGGQGDGGRSGKDDGGEPSGDAAPKPSDPGSARVYHAGDYTTAGQYDVVLTPANGTSTPLNLGAFKPGPYVGVSPDQKKLAALGRDGEKTLLRIFSLDAQGVIDAVASPVDVVLASVRSDPLLGNVRFSPDGKWIAFASDHASATAKRQQLYVVSASGGTPIAVNDAAIVNHQFRWVNTSRLFFFSAATPNPCYRADAPTFAAKELDPKCFPEEAKVDGSGRVYFRAQANGTFRVRRLVGDQVEASSVPGTTLTNNVNEPAYVGGLGISRDGKKLAFICQEKLGQNELYVLDLAQTTAKKVSDFGVTSIGAGDIRDVAWHPDGTSIVVEGQGGLYSVPAGGGAHKNIVKLTKTGEYVFDFGFGADGTLWLVGSLLDADHWGLFATTDMATAAQAPSSMSRHQPTTGRVVTLTIANAAE
jgi:hypothetical protein